MRQPSPTRDRTIEMLSQDVPLSEDSLFVRETARDRKGLIFLSDVKSPAKVPFRQPKDVVTYHLVANLRQQSPKTEPNIRRDNIPLRDKSP
jgi:hypothetical protein